MSGFLEWVAIVVALAIIAAVTVGCTATTTVDLDYCVQVEQGRICVIKTEPSEAAP